MLKPLAFRTCLAVAAWACAALAHAAPVGVQFDNFTYSGTVTRYATEADARNQINSTGGPYTIQTATNETRSTLANARDGQIAVYSEAPGYNSGDPLTYMSTSWYFTTLPNGDGWGNPNNTNDGFIQYYLGSSPTVTGGWQPGNTQFRLTVTGGNGDDLDAARLWPAPASGAAAISKGTFIDFNLDVTATFASPATLNGATGWYENNTMPASVTGTLRGIFLNNSTDAPSNGYYRFNYTVTGPGSWAAQNNATWNDGGEVNHAPVSEWAAPRAAEPATVAAVPGPGRLALLGLSLVLGLMMAARRGGRRGS